MTEKISDAIQSADPSNADVYKTNTASYQEKLNALDGEYKNAVAQGTVNIAKAVGTKTERYNLLIAVVIAVIIVLAMNLVGSLLISALVIFPALSAMRIFKSFKGVTICSAVLSVVCAFAGILISILVGTPVGSTIVPAAVVRGPDAW